jgi:GT2 family glycosyltransferase
MPVALVITFNFKGADSTEAFLKSALDLEGFALSQIIVVENGSHDGSADRLRPLIQEFANVELMESARNRGYFGAANWALQRYLTRADKPTWVIVCNNDVVFDDRQFLVNLLRQDPAAAHVIAPAIIAHPTGIDCNPFLRERPSPLQLFRYRIWQRNYYFMWFKQLLSPYVRSARHRIYFWRRSSGPQGRTPVYAPHGAFLIFSRSYFEAGGYIDDGFFLYAEEFSVAEICRQLNLSVVHDPELRVRHDAHRVTGRMCNRTTFEYGRQGFEYALRKYFHATTAGELRASRARGVVPSDDPLGPSV